MPIDVGNDDYIILCNFAGSIRSGFEIIEGVGAGWSSGSKKRLVLLGLCPQEALFSSANITDTFKECYYSHQQHHLIMSNGGLGGGETSVLPSL